MRLVWLLANFGLKLIYPFMYLGSWNKKEIIYNVNNKAKFKLRVNTIDKLIILEVWKTKTYIDKDFNIKKNDVVVDIGANIGAFSVLAAIKTQNGSVFAYEPEENNYSKLLENINGNDLHNISPSKLIISDKNGFCDLFIGNLSNATHSIHETDSKKSRRVKCITLKDIFTCNNLKKIDFLKIDAEGAEYDILLNTPSEVIRKVDKIVLEYHDYLDHNHTYNDLEKYLKGNGFKVKVCGNALERKILGTGMIKAMR